MKVEENDRKRQHSHTHTTTHEEDTRVDGGNWRGRQHQEGNFFRMSEI
jgi:hypothetical protein